MEHLKKRIEINSLSVKVQTVKKLLGCVTSKVKECEIINSTTPVIAELQLLWEWCTDTDAIVCVTSCDALFSLVESGKADVSYIINGLLNVVPSAKNLSGLVKTIVDILVLQMLVTMETENTYTCPYSLRNPPHPLVTILTNRSDAWHLLQQQILRLLRWKNERVQCHAISLLMPFLKFSLLEPHQSNQFVPFRLGLVNTLLEGSRGTALKPQVLQFLLDILPCLQVETVNNIGEALSLVQTLLNDLRPTPEDNHRYLSQLITHILGLSKAAILNGLDCSELLVTLVEILKSNPEIIESELAILQVVDLLAFAPVTLHESLLKIGTLYAKNAGDSESLLVCMLFLPVLHIVATPEAVDNQKTTRHQLTSHLLVAMENYISKDSNKAETKNAVKNLENRHSFAILSSCCFHDISVRLVTMFKSNLSHARDWLRDILPVLDRVDHIPCHVTYLISSLIVVTSDISIVVDCLSALSKIVAKEPSQAPAVLPLLMYKLAREQDPQSTVKILTTLPSLATHKVMISPVLRVLQRLGSLSKLRALSIRLITLLWQQQDRCFPHLQQLLATTDSSSVVKETKINELMVAKAASIRDICQHRPSQYGEDMLAPLSAILTDCITEEEAAGAALALQGLFYLCQAEVIDIRTAWSVLAGRLKQDTRPLVLSRLCNLFSLVPSLDVQSKQYKTFTSEVLLVLWTYAAGSNQLAAGSAYKALASYSPDLFQLQHFPPEIISDIRSPEEDQQDEQAGIPAICYIRLLRQVASHVLPDYGVLLTSLVCQEVVNLPRGIYHASYRKQASTARSNKSLAVIPSFLLEQFDKSRQPAVRPGLACGLLFCYEPVVGVGRDGKTHATHIAQRGRQYHQMLYALMNDVSPQPSEWHRTLLAPAAWASFMHRCYLAYLEGRKAELALTMDRGKVVDTEQHGEDEETAWLWARDKLTDLIKSSSRGSPSVQANSVFALAGLAVAACKYSSSLEAGTDKSSQNASGHLGQNHWLMIAANTILSVLDVTFQPATRTFTMCQQRGGHERTAGPGLTRAAAALALARLIPTLITSNADLVFSILDTLMKGLPGECSAKTTSSLGFNYGLGLGLVLGELFEERFADVAGTQGMVTVWKAVDALEKSAFGTNDHRLGSIVGLGVCLTALCTEGKTDSKVHVCSVHEQLTVAMEMITCSEPHCVYEGFAMCVSYASVSAYCTNILGQGVVDRVAAKLYQEHCLNPQNMGLCLALGTICFGLHEAGHPNVGDLIQKLHQTWMSVLQDEDQCTAEKLAALHGLGALAGTQKSLLPLQEQSGNTPCVNIADIVKVISHGVTTASDVDLQKECACILGQLHFAACTSTDTRGSVPGNYHYLPETSVIRVLIDLLIEAGKLGPEGVDVGQVKTVLESLVKGPPKSLPPLNWTGILSPLMRMSYGSEVQTLCLRLALKQSTVSPSASLFCSAWLQNPLYDCLQVSTRWVVLESLDTLVKTVAASKLGEYLERGFLESFTSVSRRTDTETTCLETTCLAALKGLHKALQMHDPPKTVSMLLFKTLEALYEQLQNPVNIRVSYAIGECLREVPDAIVDNITGADFTSNDALPKGVYVRCHLVATGSQPIVWLNKAIEAVIDTNNPDGKVCMWLLMQCFYSCKTSDSEHCGVMKRLQWMVELMGHMKTLVSNSATSTTQVVGNMFVVFKAAVVAWSDVGAEFIFGFHSFNSPPQPTDHQSGLWWGQQAEVGGGTPLMRDALTLLTPPALESLLQLEPWKQITGKVIEWLLFLRGLPQIKENTDDITSVNACLYALRHCKEFKKMTTWTRVFSTE